MLGLRLCLRLDLVLCLGLDLNVSVRFDFRVRFILGLESGLGIVCMLIFECTLE